MRRYRWWAVPALLAAACGAAAMEVTPSQVYREVLVVEQQVELIEKHLKVRVHGDDPRPIRSQLKPRHAWQKAYEILFKVNLLREQYGLPVVSIGTVAPQRDLEPLLTYEEVRRIQSELDLLLFRLGIERRPVPIAEVKGKRPTDVYNALRAVSRHLDDIRRAETVPSQVFGEAMRIYEDIAAILIHLGVSDETLPPDRIEDATPADAFRNGYRLLEEVQHVQRMIDLPISDLSEFNTERATPADVFELTQLIIAELQPIKAHLHMDDELTPAARHYEGKRPAEVAQLLGWLLRKMWLIDRDHFERAEDIHER